MIAPTIGGLMRRSVVAAARLRQLQRKPCDSELAIDRGAAQGTSMRLSTRLTIAMVALVLLATTAVGVLTYRNIAAFALPRALDRLESHAELLGSELAASVRGARGD